MQFQRIFVPVAAVAGVMAGYSSYGWPGVAIASGLLLMWLLLHFTRLMQVLKRAANRPIGYVDSAVMLNAKLRAGVSLLHVVAMTKALGALESSKDVQPEVFRWTDETQSHVSCEFHHGKLRKWELHRPAPSETAAPASGAAQAS